MMDRVIDVARRKLPSVEFNRTTGAEIAAERLPSRRAALLSF